MAGLKQLAGERGQSPCGRDAMARGASIALSAERHRGYGMREVVHAFRYSARIRQGMDFRDKRPDGRVWGSTVPTSPPALAAAIKRASSIPTVGLMSRPGLGVARYSRKAMAHYFDWCWRCFVEVAFFEKYG